MLKIKIQAIHEARMEISDIVLKTGDPAAILNSAVNNLKKDIRASIASGAEARFVITTEEDPTND